MSAKNSILAKQFALTISKKEFEYMLFDKHKVCCTYQKVLP